MATPQTFEPIEDYLKQQVVDQSILPPDCLMFENDNFTPPPGPAIWAMVEVFGTIFNQASIGAGQPTENRWREFGYVYVHVMTPRGQGSREARTIARKFADLFRGLELAGLEFAGVSIGAGEPGDEDGNYWRMTATAEFRRDENGS